MIRVVVLASTPPTRGIIEKAVQKLRGSGATVQLMGTFRPQAIDLDQLDVQGFTSLPRPNQQKIDGKADNEGVARQIWASLQKSREAMALAATAHVLIALDGPAVYALWNIAQRNKRAAVCFGVRAGLQAVEARRDHPFRSIFTDTRHAGSTLRGLAKRRVVRAIPDPQTLLQSADKADLPPRNPVQRAQRLFTEFQDNERVGVFDRDQQRSALEATSLAADRRLDRDDLESAAKWLLRSFRVTFHRSMHFDRLESPLATEPEDFLAPLLGGDTYRRFATPRGRLEPAAEPPTGRKLRLLVTTYTNDNFLGEILERYQDHPDIELRFVDFADDEVLRRLAQLSGRAEGVAHRLGAPIEMAAEAERALRPLLDWADTVFIDWCTNAPALLTMVDPGTTRMILRLHSYEAFTKWPHFVDFSRVDDMVFVSEHLRDFGVRVIPGLAAEQAPRLHVVPNAMDLTPYRRPKLDDDMRFSLGLVGCRAVVKDPMWALDVLEKLRETDDRYRLTLVGDLEGRGYTAAAQPYLDALSERVEPLVGQGAVQLVGHTDDVPDVLRRIGVILSTSVRESFHCALVEGAASGAVPVVRDWPFFAGYAHSARTLFWEDWVVETPEQAADRVLRLTKSAATWREAGDAAQALVMDRWDWQTSASELDEVLLGARTRPTP